MPADLSELRGLIVCVTFIATAVSLIAIMPSGFFAPSATQFINPKSGVLYNVLAWNASTYYNFTGPNNGEGVPHEVGVGTIGGNFYVISEVKADAGGGTYYYYFLIEQADYWAGFWGYASWNREDATWMYRNGTVISSRQSVYTPDSRGNPVSHLVIKVTDIDKLWAEALILNSSELTYMIQTSKWTMQVSFTFNYTAFQHPSSAYFAVPCQLAMNLWITYDERATTITAWSLITGIMFFQLIPDLPTIISVIIEAPIWVCEIYLVFSFVLRIISAIMGGG